MVRVAGRSPRKGGAGDHNRLLLLLHQKWFLLLVGVVSVIVILLLGKSNDSIVPDLFQQQGDDPEGVTMGVGGRRNAQAEEQKKDLSAAGTSSSSSSNINNKHYDESKILKLSDTLIPESKQTIVTAYFRIRSKHSNDNYKKWMANMLSLQDPMVIFLSAELIPEIQQLRQHALNRTVIIPMELSNVPLAQRYNTSFWSWQFDIDKEKRVHRSYEVFWIWLSKSWWVTEAIRHNFFNSEIFVWSDMGCFRNQQYNNKEMVLHPDQIPRNSVMFLAHHPINPPPTPIFNNKYDKEMKPHFYTSGSMMAGYGDTFTKFHNYFEETIQEFLDRDMFIGEDQLVLQSTCLLHPDLCAYVSNNQVNDNHYFGLRYILHVGGNYRLWYPPGNTQQQQQ